jgi:hypothetical protein
MDVCIFRSFIEDLKINLSAPISLISSLRRPVKSNIPRTKIGGRGFILVPWESRGGKFLFEV